MAELATLVLASNNGRAGGFALLPFADNSA
jgi:hypothetical protein